MNMEQEQYKINNSVLTLSFHVKEFTIGSQLDQFDLYTCLIGFIFNSNVRPRMVQIIIMVIWQSSLTGLLMFIFVSINVSEQQYSDQV